MLSALMSSYAHSRDNLQECNNIEEFLSQLSSIEVGNQLRENPLFADVASNSRVFEAISACKQDRSSPEKIEVLVRMLKTDCSYEHELMKDSDFEALAILAYLGKFISEDDLVTILIMRGVQAEHRMVSLFDDRNNPTEEVWNLLEAKVGYADDVALFFDRIEEFSSVQLQTAIIDNAHIVTTIGMIRELYAVTNHTKKPPLELHFKIANETSSEEGQAIKLPLMLAGSYNKKTIANAALRVFSILQSI